MVSINMSQSNDSPKPQVKIERLLQYCVEQGIIISQTLQIQYSPSSGFGLYATKKIKKGQRVIHAPTSCLITTASVPSTFLPDPTFREDLTVHGLLAAWLAFGDQEEIQERFGPWIDVWPSWESFREGMPVFWSLDGYSLHHPTTSNEVECRMDVQTNKRKKRKTSNGVSAHKTCSPHGIHVLKPAFTFSPAIEGTYLGTKKFSAPCKSENPGLLAVQARKISCILQLLQQHASLLGFDILESNSQESLRHFLHMWSCVNTRCFYYLPLNTPAPSDPNEAMALVPFQDLFNHSTLEAGCKTKFDKTGFSVYANKDYNEGDELYLLYGHHSEDALWLEYGFIHEAPSKNLAPPNKDDSLPLDPIVLNSLNAQHKTILVDKEYLGSYTLTQSGICYRTEVTAWLVSDVLNQSEWEGMLEGTFDAESQPSKKYQEQKKKVMATIVNWLSCIRIECHHNLSTLLQLGEGNDEDSIKAFLPNQTLLTQREKDEKLKIAALARGRWEMCIKRWKGIYELYAHAIRAIEDECPGSFVNVKEGRTKKMLMMGADDFIKQLLREEKNGKRPDR